MNSCGEEMTTAEEGNHKIKGHFLGLNKNDRENDAMALRVGLVCTIICSSGIIC